MEGEAFHMAAHHADSSYQTNHGRATPQDFRAARTVMWSPRSLTSIHAQDGQCAEVAPTPARVPKTASSPVNHLESSPTVDLVGDASNPKASGLSTRSLASSWLTVEEPSSSHLTAIAAEARSASKSGADTDSTHSKSESDATALEKEADTNHALHTVASLSDKIACGDYLDELANSHALPDVNLPRWWNVLRHGILSMYRRLFILVLLGNFAALLYCVWMSALDPARITYNDAATAVSANLFVGALMRHEHCINFLFRFFVAIPHWCPLSVRRLAAKVYSYGGVHSACGISGLAWYIYFTALFALQTQDWAPAKTKAIAILSGCILLMLMILIVMSHPKLRTKYHDQWELCHRYCGWTSIAIIWVQVVLIAYLVVSTSIDESVGHALITTPAFWFLLAITALIIYPWLHLRKIRYTPEQLSPHALRLWIHEPRVLPLCVGIRLTHAPFKENHGFATIPNPDNQPGYSVLISNAGDWTKRIITSPPPHLWAKGAFTIGVMRVALLFSPIVIVATGSGIGPCLSFLQVHPDYPCRIVWSARHPEATYGREVLMSVFRADPNAIVIDTKKTGKPNLVKLVHAVYKEAGAEAVTIISNPATTREVVFELETRKVPAFGAIFDS